MKSNFDKYYNEARMTRKIPRYVNLWSSAKGKEDDIERECPTCSFKGKFIKTAYSNMGQRRCPECGALIDFGNPSAGRKQYGEAVGIYDEPALVEKAKAAKTADEARKAIESSVFGQYKDTDEAEKAIEKILSKAGK